MLSFSSASILTSPIFLTLSTVFPLNIPFCLHSGFFSPMYLLFTHQPLLFSYFYLSISGPFTHTFFFLVAIFYLFFHSRTLSLSQTVGFSRRVGKVEKVTLEINGACISLASPLHQIGFLLSSSYTMHNSSVPHSLSLIFVALFLHPFSFLAFSPVFASHYLTHFSCQVLQS